MDTDKATTTEQQQHIRELTKKQRLPTSTKIKQMKKQTKCHVRSAYGHILFVRLLGYQEQKVELNGKTKGKITWNSSSKMA